MTEKKLLNFNFVLRNKSVDLTELKAIAITHSNFELEEIGLFHIVPDVQEQKLVAIKEALKLDELLYISTCNRVEFLISSPYAFDFDIIVDLLQLVNTNLSANQAFELAKKVQVFEGKNAVNHLFRVASSLDSLVVGEREIITQVRNAFDFCKKIGVSGDLVRIVIRSTIETAKRIYTETEIASQPVSIVSLAYRKLKDLINLNHKTKVLLVGAGETNTTMARLLKKHGVSDFTVYNRTLDNATLLINEIGGEAFSLDKLGFQEHSNIDVIVSCTSSDNFMINKEVFDVITKNSEIKPVLVDLAIPNDIDSELESETALVSINKLKDIAKQNLAQRKKEVDSCELIVENSLEDFYEMYHTRRVELAMSALPKKVKDIKQTAFNSVFAKELELLDDDSKDLLDKMVGYFEKKYISIPMKMAKEIMLQGYQNKK